MGYELDRLMKQFGVSSPTLSYTGTASSTNPTQSAANAADKALYDKYKDDYQNRISNTSGYIQNQFQTNRPKTMSDLYQTYLGRAPDAAGLAYWESRFPNSMTQEGKREFAQSAMPELMQGGINSGPAFYAATGNNFSNTLSVPSYQNYVAPKAEILAPEKTATTQTTNVPHWVSESGWEYAKGGAVKIDDSTFSAIPPFVDGQPPSIPDFSGYGNELDAGEPFPLPLVTDTGSYNIVDAGIAPEQPQQQSQPNQNGLGNLLDMLNKYNNQETSYGDELKQAREKSTAEIEAFNKKIADLQAGNLKDQPSKSEMYFRLAAAFGAPTKTGNFMESLGNATKAAADYAKEGRDSKNAANALNMQLGLEGQKAKIANAKEDLNNLRALASEEMKDKRAITSSLIKDYQQSAKPESMFGKQAQDEGLKPGTPEFKKRVSSLAQSEQARKDLISDANSKRLLAQNDALNLRQQMFEQKKKLDTKLTPQEMKLKEATENDIASNQSILNNLSRAYALNPNTFDASLIGMAQRKVLEAAGSDNEKVVNTRELENLLSRDALSALKSTFGANPTEGERKIQMSLEGIQAKSIEERKKILLNAYAVAKSALERKQKRLAEINKGAYRETAQTADFNNQGGN